MGAHLARLPASNNPRTTTRNASESRPRGAHDRCSDYRTVTVTVVQLQSWPVIHGNIMRYLTRCLDSRGTEQLVTINPRGCSWGAAGNWGYLSAPTVQCSLASHKIGKITDEVVVLTRLDSFVGHSSLLQAALCGVLPLCARGELRCPVLDPRVRAQVVPSLYNVI